MAMTPIPVLDRTSATFKSDVDTFFGTRLPAFAAEANALQADVAAKQATASTAATTATTKASEASASAVTATTKATEASNSAAAALASKNAAAASASNAATSAAAAEAAKNATTTGTKANLGLGNVDNTSDATKPVSTAQAAALNLKANLASPALTGTPTAPTAVAGTSTTQLATTAFAKAEAALRYGKDNVLGTVSQSAGVPTGALIEYGSNANGEYWRYAGGMQVCTRNRFITAAVATVASSGLYRTAVDQTWNYPAAFSSPPMPGGSVTDVVPLAFLASPANGYDSPTFFGFNVMTASSASGSAVNLFAIGRWHN